MTQVTSPTEEMKKTNFYELSEEELHRVVEEQTERSESNAKFIEEQAALVKELIGASQARRRQAENATIESLKAENVQLKKDLKMTTTGKDLLQKKVDILSTKTQELSNENTRLEDQVHDLTAALSALQNTCSQLQKTNTEKCAEIQQITEHFVDFRQQSLDQEMAARGVLETERRTTQQLREQLALLEARHVEEQHESNALREVNVELREQLNLALDMNTRKEDEVKERLSGALVRANDEVEELRLHVDALQQQMLRQSEEHVMELERREISIGEEAEQVETVIRALQDRIASLNVELGREQQKLTSIQSECQFETERLRASAEAAAAESKLHQARATEVAAALKALSEELSEARKKSTLVVHRAVQTTTEAADIPPLRAELKSTQEQLATSISREQGLKNAFSDLQARHDALVEELDRSKLEVKGLQAEKGRLASSAQSQLDASTSWKAKCADLETQNRTQLHQLESAGDESHRLQRAIHNLESLLDEQSKNLNNTKLLHQSATREVQQLEEERCRLQGELDRQGKDVLSLKQALETEKENVKQEKEGRAAIQQELAATTHRYDDQVRELDLVIQQQTVLQKEKDGADSRVAEMVLQQRKLDEENKELHSALDNLSLQVARLEGQIRDTSALLRGTFDEMDFEDESGDNDGKTLTLQGRGSSAPTLSVVALVYKCAQKYTTVHSLYQMQTEKFDQLSTKFSFLESLLLEEGYSKNLEHLHSIVASCVHAESRRVDSEIPLQADHHSYPQSADGEPFDSFDTLAPRLIDTVWVVNHYDEVARRHEEQLSEARARVAAAEASRYEVEEQLSHALTGDARTRFAILQRPELLRQLVQLNGLVSSQNQSCMSVERCIVEALDVAEGSELDAELTSVAEKGQALEAQVAFLIDDFFTKPEKDEAGVVKVPLSEQQQLMASSDQEKASLVPPTPQPLPNSKQHAR